MWLRVNSLIIITRNWLNVVYSCPLKWSSWVLTREFHDRNSYSQLNRIQICSILSFSSTIIHSNSLITTQECMLQPIILYTDMAALEAIKMIVGLSFHHTQWDFLNTGFLRGFRVGFNSLCALASVNHQHLHAWYLGKPMPLEDEVGSCRF